MEGTSTLTCSTFTMGIIEQMLFGKVYILKIITNTSNSMCACIGVRRQYTVGAAKAL
jgi:hypothetical protein